MTTLRVINPNPPDDPKAPHEGEEAFVAELTSLQSSLQAHIQSMLPGDPAVDDVVHRTNLELWRKRDSGPLDGDFRDWAFGVATQTVAAHLKDKRRRP